MFIFNYATVIDPLLRDIRLYASEFSGMKAGDRVLDVCCGTGDQVFHYSKRDIIAVGVDLSSNMLELAAKKRIKQGLGNASFQQANATNLPFKDGCFDYVSASFGLHDKEIGTRNRLVSEMKRVVKKGGALVFIDFAVPLPKNLYGYLVRTIEFLAGREHFRGFKDYIKRGGLDEILENHQLLEEKRECLKNGIILIVKAKETNASSLYLF